MRPFGGTSSNPQNRSGSFLGHAQRILGWAPEPSEVHNTPYIPDAEPTELNWPVQSRTDDEEDATARTALFQITALSFVVTLLVQLGGKLWVTPDGIVAGTTLSSMVAVSYLVSGRANFGVAARIWAVGLVLPIVFYLIYMALRVPGAFVVTTALAVGFAGVFIEEFRYHYVSRMLVGPMVPRGVHIRRSQFYDNRFNALRILQFIREEGRPAVARGLDPAVSKLRRAELRALLSTRGPALIVLLAGLLLPVLPHFLFSATLTVIAPVVGLLWFSDGAVSYRQSFNVLWAAWKSWVNYERGNPAPAPGVWHSPVGIQPWRMVLAFGAVFFTATAIAPSVHFFPVLFELSLGRAFSPEVKAALATPGSPAWLLEVAKTLPDSFWHLWALGLSLVLSLVVPLLVLASATYVGAGAFLVRAHLALNVEDAPELKDRS